MIELPPQSVFFGFGILSALVAVVVLSRRRGVDIGTSFGLFSLAAVTAVVGARVLWCVVSPEAGIDLVIERPELLWHPLRGGFASLGGWIGAGVVAWLGTRRWSWTRRWKMGDALLPSGLLGMAVARLGCLSNGCDFGAAVGWGIRYSPGTPAYRAHLERNLIESGAIESAPTFPLPLVLAGATAAIVCGAFFAVKRLGVGVTAVLSSGAYFAVRFIVETFRSPATVEMIFGPFNINHVLALIGLVVTALMWRLFGDGGAESVHPPG